MTIPILNPTLYSDIRNLDRRISSIERSLNIYPTQFIMYLANSTAAVFPNNTITKVPFDTFEYDNTNGSASLLNTNFVVPKSGTYLFSAGVQLGTNLADGSANTMELYANATLYRRMNQEAQGIANNFGTWGSAMAVCNVDDIIDVRFLHNGGVSATATAGKALTFFSGFRLSD